jgi:hypothetical protein
VNFDASLNEYIPDILQVILVGAEPHRQAQVISHCFIRKGYGAFDDRVALNYCFGEFQVWNFEATKELFIIEDLPC